MQLLEDLALNLLSLLFAIFTGEKYYPQSTESTSNLLASEYDFIIVGAGSAGCVVANRLSEDPCVTVLLLEAGTCPPALSEVPLFGPTMSLTDINWRYITVPQEKAGYALENQEFIWHRGKVLGGTSILNGMIYMRGNRKDYDDWENIYGATGWKWDKVSPFFKKSEDNKDIEEVDDGYHGQGGYLTVAAPKYETEIGKAFMKSAAFMGYANVDSNGENQTGFSFLQGTMRNGTRCSTAKAFLVPAENRTNLKIVSDAYVTKIIFDKIFDKKAIGVCYDDSQKKSHQVTAKKEIIVSGGAINSPRLLMLSGIGPKKHLEKLDIPVVLDLLVGENLQDHIGCPSLCYTINKEVQYPYGLINPKNCLNYTLNKKGPYTSFSGIEGVGFINSDYANCSEDWPDIELHMLSGSLAGFGPFLNDFLGMKLSFYEQVFLPYALSNSFTCIPYLLRPESRGYIRLKSSDPYEYPLIDPKYFDKEDDLNTLVSGMKFCKKLALTKPFQELNPRPFNTIYPGCEGCLKNEHEYLKCVARTLPLTIFHFAGTCKMGKKTDPTAVVDPELRVIGIEGLRVVDASVMPRLVSGNPNAAIIMIAEMASDMIKKRWKSCQ